jgi:predicted phage gp36 major capsid-like protein
VLSELSTRLEWCRDRGIDRSAHRAGVRVLRDPFSAKPYMLFYTTKRVGGGVQDFDAVKLLKFVVS